MKTFDPRASLKRAVNHYTQWALREAAQSAPRAVPDIAAARRDLEDRIAKALEGTEDQFAVRRYSIAYVVCRNWLIDRTKKERGIARREKREAERRKRARKEARRKAARRRKREAVRPEFQRLRDDILEGRLKVARGGVDLAQRLAILEARAFERASDAELLQRFSCPSRAALHKRLERIRTRLMPHVSRALKCVLLEGCQKKRNR